MAEIFGFDCYSPRDIAERVETVGVAKANLPFTSMAAPEELGKWISRKLEMGSG